MSRNELINALQLKKKNVEPDQEVTVDLFKPQDALGVSLAYLETYGDSFPIEHVYSPEEVTRRNETDDQYTVVARTPKGDIVGLGGLFRHAPNKNVYEAGQLMVLKPYRNGKISKQLSTLLLEELPKQLGLKVIFAEAVCNHMVSQQLAYNQGLKATAIGIECMPSQAYSTEGDVKSNVSLLLMFIVKADSHHEVYLPAPYANQLKESYNTLSLSRSEGISKGLNETTIYDEFLLPEANFSRITIKQSGADFNDILNTIEKTAGTDGLIQLYINIGDSAAPEAVTLLRERGYIFGGLLPLWFGSDGIIMQKLPHEPKWGEIKLRHQESRKLLEEVHTDYNTITLTE